MNFELETIPQSTFLKIEDYVKNENFELKKVKNLSKCFLNVLMWVMGVIEFHRVIRKYSLSSFDFDILNEEELEFFEEMDSITLLYYKLLRYSNTFCKPFEKDAKEYISAMNI
jgi:hypothetical protein